MIDIFLVRARCSNCGHVLEKLPLTIREWDCRIGGSHHDRDINASINILAAGLAVSVCGAIVRPEGSKSRLYGCYLSEAPLKEAAENP